VACAQPATAVAGSETGWAPVLRIRRTTDPYGLRLIGEADLSNRRALGATLDNVLDQQPDPAVPIHLDVSGLRFADAGAAALLGRLASRAPMGMRVTGVQPALEMVFDRLGVAQIPTLRLIRVGDGRTEVVA
jgi:anti-anti-sigma regulatory factor